MCGDCTTLKYCCKRTCDCDNPYFGIPMRIIFWTFVVALGYFTVIGYGCLWSQFVWNNVFGHKTSCTNPFVLEVFFGTYIVTGIGALLTTAIALVIVGVAIAVIGFLIYGLYLLISGCCQCCKTNYALAEVDAKAHKATEKAPLLQVNVEKN